MLIFEGTKRPDPQLLFNKNDPNDVRLGETVWIDPIHYEEAQIVLLGLPQDEGVRRNVGRVGAKDAPDAIKRCLYKLVDIPGLKLFDLGHTRIQDTLEATHDLHREIVRGLIRDGKIVIVLGGGNDTSYPDCSALALESEDAVLAFNIDAHFDVRADQPRNSGTPYRQLIEEEHIKAQDFYVLGYQRYAASPTYLDYFKQRGTLETNLHSIQAVHTAGLSTLWGAIAEHEKHADQPIFLGLDMDAIHAHDAPGVSAINPSGLDGLEVIDLAEVAGANPRTRIFEITEVNPTFDIDERTCRLAGVIIWHFLSAIQKRR